MSVTVITMLKRRPGMSREDFVAYYESNHARIGEKVLKDYATRYVRRYIEPLDGIERPDDYDVVMEIDFPDQARRDAFFQWVGDDQAIMDMIAEDEEKLFDRDRIRTFTVAGRGDSF